MKQTIRQYIDRRTAEIYNEEGVSLRKTLGVTDDSRIYYTVHCTDLADHGGLLYIHEGDVLLMQRDVSMDIKKWKASHFNPARFTCRKGSDHRLSFKVSPWASSSGGAIAPEILISSVVLRTVEIS